MDGITSYTYFSADTKPPPPKGKPPRKMEFSKKLMLLSTFMFAGTWAAALASWFMFREIPWEFAQYATWLYGASFVSYCAKTAYKNKSKIEKWSDDN